MKNLPASHYCIARYGRIRRFFKKLFLKFTALLDSSYNCFCLHMLPFFPADIDITQKYFSYSGGVCT